MSDTPRTDAACIDADAGQWTRKVDASFARKLERELADARKDKERLDILEDVFSISDDGSKTWKDVISNANERGWRYAADVLMRENMKI